MTAILRFSLPVPPSSRDAHRAAPGRGIVLSGEATAYYAKIRRLLVGRVRPLYGDVTARVTWYRAARQGDLDDRLKLFQDSLNCIAYLDDKQIAKYAPLERRDDQPYHPRFEVELEAERFATEEELTVFVERKQSATKKRRATIHASRKAKAALQQAKKVRVTPAVYR